MQKSHKSCANRLAWAGALLAIFPVVWLLRPLLIKDVLPICPFRIATALPCPFCGLTRALAHAVHGDLGLAWENNPLWVVAAPLLLALGLLLATDGMRGTDLVSRFEATLYKYWPIGAVGLIIFGFWRMVVA